MHEYQSKDLMRKYGILVQRGDIATTALEAMEVAKQLDVREGDLILKAQVHAGGRGKGTIYINNRNPFQWTSGRSPDPEDS